jgi:UDP-glucose 4-epimerase
MYQRSATSKGLVLVTGGAGYVGSHTLIELLGNGFDVVCLDNCVNAIRPDLHSLPVGLQRVEQICGRKLVEFVDICLLNEDGLKQLFTKYAFDAVIHFAGLKAVGESCNQPLRYYRNNVAGTLNLLQAMSDSQVGRLIFSSSCTVYGSPQYLPVDEDHPTGLQIINPYGRTKYMIEQILHDCAAAEKKFSVISLR